MIGGFWAPGLARNPSLKAGVWGEESDAPAFRRGSRIKTPTANQPPKTASLSERVDDIISLEIRFWVVVLHGQSYV
jgi:hypothetical protein